MDTQMELDHLLVLLSKAHKKVLWPGRYDRAHPLHMYCDPILGNLDWIQGLPKDAFQSQIGSSSG